ncbi:H-NS histone family protein [Alteromonas sp. ASW11-19]|uniref:DNA-binding protein n=1 Tax=Alteromonas salexigens TaxID=2982530 RepID=A0ABT2VLS5_9ALTE|nr:H-NS family nucleoid-associated regulatory protein [Alteromonas salexigens]MCU7554004.1 H-NS histone family protein [Alteromonas salexigens]
MSEFLDILTHGRRLQGAVKELSIQELESVQDKLGNIIEKRKQKALEQEQAEKEKLAKIAEIQKQMEEAGVKVDDLKVSSSDTPKKTTGKKRPVKYQITDKDGKTHPWTGIGRMPKVFKEAIDNGKKLQDFSI